MSEHSRVVRLAKEANRKVFWDRSVSPETTRDSLKELQDEIADYIFALRADIKAAEAAGGKYGKQT